MKALKNNIGFDLGTSYWRFYSNGKQVINIPAEIELKEGLHSHIIANGKIADFCGAELLLRREIHKIKKPFLGFLHLPFKALISIPSDGNTVAQRAFVDSMQFSGARYCFLLNDCFIAATGLELNLENNTSIIVDSGAGKTSITTIQGLNIVKNEIIDIAGLTFDAAIENYLSYKYGLLIDLKAAEKLKIEFVDLRKNNASDRSVRVSGHDKLTKEMKTISMQISEFTECVRNDIEILVERLCRHFENLEDVDINKIKSSGIYLIGNGFKLKGLMELISERLPIASKSYSLGTDYMRIGFEKVQMHPELLYSKMIKIYSTYND